MSGLLVSKVLQLDLSKRDKAVLVVMADHADDDGTGIYPGVERIADMSEYSRRSVLRAIESLKGKGLIETVSEPEPEKGKSTEWRIKLAGDTVTTAGDTVTTAGDTVTTAGDTVTSSGRHCDELAGDTVSPQQLNSNSNNNRQENKAPARTNESNQQDKSNTVTLQAFVEMWNSKENLADQQPMIRPDAQRRFEQMMENGWGRETLESAIENLDYLLDCYDRIIGINNSWNLVEFIEHNSGDTAWKVANSPESFEPESEQEADNDNLDPEIREIRAKARRANPNFDGDPYE